MCPSFQATGNEIDTTRARAQSLRGIIHGDLPLSTIHSDDLYQVMDLCIECKGCQKECPSQVDMAKMKAEFLYQYQQKHGISLRNRLFANVGKMNSWMTHCSGLFNGFIESFPGKKLREWVGISTDVPLPKLATERFSRRAAQFSTERGTSQKTRPSVILFNDTFTEFNHPEIGWATLHLLDSLGYDVIVTKWQCCGRPLFTKGLLHHARKAIYAHINALAPFAQRKQPILFLEPSCYSLFKTDALTLIDPEQKEQVAILAEIAANCYTLEEFLLKHLHEDKKLCLQIPKQRVWVHGHCHQKALTGMDPTIDLFRALPGIELHVIDAGCCGMAGAFGYEAEHVTISGAIGELKLFPTVRKIPAQEILVANGMSCRSHVCHHTGKRALHLAEFLGRCCINHH